MKINLEHQEAFVDEGIHIKVVDLDPNTQLKVSLKMEFPWCSGEEFSSYAIFAADEMGEVDFEQTKPVEGTYETANSMGLIYSLKLSKSSGKNIAENIFIEKPIIMNLFFQSPTERKEVQLKRIFKSEKVLVKHVHEGFTGQLFYQKNSNNITILMLGGSDGQMQALSLIAGPLASRGFNVLTVSYFASEELPEKLEEVPLEYFEKIFQWIENNEITRMKNIYLHGTSKGGELALLLASRYKQIKKVVAVEPHTYCFQALDGLMSGKNVSSWAYQGKSIPFIEVDNKTFFENQKKDIEKGIPFGFASTYRKSIEKATNLEEARIKVENSEADILLICGKKDNIWDSYEACLEILKNLKSINYNHHVELLSYENMGHPLPVPYILPLSMTLRMPMNGGMFSTGGTVEGNIEGQIQSFTRTIEFFHEL